MAVRDFEKAIPLIPAMEITAEDLGYSTGDNDYKLISFCSRLCIGSENTYLVFVLSGSNVTQYNWKVRRFEYQTNNIEDIPNAPPGQFSNIDQSTDNGEFFWTPIEEGRFQISVEIKDGEVTRQTLTLTNTVFNALDQREINNEAQAELLGMGMPEILDLFIAGNIPIIQELIHDYWEYIINESTRVANFIIPPKLLAGILYYHILNLGKKDRKRFINEFISFPRNSRLLRLGLSEMPLELAAMIAGITLWQDKVDDHETWVGTENQMYKNLEKINKEQKISIFNLIRFPKSHIALIGRLIRRFDVGAIPVDNRDNAICRHYLKYSTFNNPALNLDEELNKIIRLSNTPGIHPYFPTLSPDTIETPHNADLLLDSNNAAVLELKNDLNALGFSLAFENINNDNPVDQNFRLFTEWAVREFQIYAKMRFIAKIRENAQTAESNPVPFHLRLRRCVNLCRYMGPVSGVANKETRKLIKIWKAMHWRCPVVVSAYPPTINESPNINNLTNFNFWRSRIMPNVNPRIYVQDYSNYYTIPETRKFLESNPLLSDGFITLGTYASSQDYNQDGGPLAATNHVWWGNGGSELLPNTFFQTNIPENISTFKVIRAAAEQECIGFFDSINSWDNAYVSIGPCHWTFPQRKSYPTTPQNNRRIQEGELCAYLSFLKRKDLNTFRKAIQFFGLKMSALWRDIPLSAVANYTADLLFQDNNFNFIDYKTAPNNHQNVIQNGAKLEYVRTWHWFYRFMMATRTINEFNRYMWIMTRIRIRDILNSDFRDGDGNNRRIGDIFTSERSIALILRAHIYSPVWIINSNGRGLHRAFINAQANDPQLNNPTNTWGNDQEAVLISHLLDELNLIGPNNNFQNTHDWPTWNNAHNPNRYTLDITALGDVVQPQGGRLQMARNSFNFAQVTAEEEEKNIA